MTDLSRFYFGYGSVVGGPLLLLMLIGTQAAHSPAEGMLAIMLGLIAPVPMLVLGIALRRGWRVAPLLCIALPVVLTIIVAQVWGQSEPPRSAGTFRVAVFNTEYSQLYFLPGAFVLGAIVLGRVACGRYRHEDARVG